MSRDPDRRLRPGQPGRAASRQTACYRNRRFRTRTSSDSGADLVIVLTLMKRGRAGSGWSAPVGRDDREIVVLPGDGWFEVGVAEPCELVGQGAGLIVGAVDGCVPEDLLAAAHVLGRCVGSQRRVLPDSWLDTADLNGAQLGEADLRSVRFGSTAGCTAGRHGRRAQVGLAEIANVGSWSSERPAALGARRAVVASGSRNWRHLAGRRPGRLAGFARRTCCVRVWSDVSGRHRLHADGWSARAARPAATRRPATGKPSARQATVREGDLNPHALGRQILSLLRLPFRHSRAPLAYRSVRGRWAGRGWAWWARRRAMHLRARR